MIFFIPFIFGHPIGDKVLIKMSGFIKQSIRSDDRIGRWGGEEFLVLCPQSNEDEALNIAKRIQMAIHTGIFSTHELHTVSISIRAFTDEETPYTPISHAADTLYKAKIQVAIQFVGLLLARLFK